MSQSTIYSSQDGQTALHYASRSGHTDVVKLLVESGAQLDNKDNVSTEQSTRALKCITLGL